MTWIYSWPGLIHDLDLLMTWIYSWTGFTHELDLLMNWIYSWPGFTHELHLLMNSIYSWHASHPVADFAICSPLPTPLTTLWSLRLYMRTVQNNSAHINNDLCCHKMSFNSRCTTHNHMCMVDSYNAAALHFKYHCHWCKQPRKCHCSHHYTSIAWTGTRASPCPLTTLPMTIICLVHRQCDPKVELYTFPKPSATS